PEHHPASARRDLAMNFFQKFKIDAPFAFAVAQLFALAAAKVPSLITTDIETAAREMRQQFIVKFAQKRQRARMLGRQRRRIPQEGAARALIRCADLAQLPQWRILQPITQVPKRILVWNQIDS